MRKVLSQTIFCVILCFFCVSVLAQSTYRQHPVADGETLYRIASQYELTVDEIKSLNPWIVGNRIVPGDVLVVPAKKVATVDDAAPSVINVSQLEENVPVPTADELPIMGDDKIDLIPIIEVEETSASPAATEEEKTPVSVADRLSQMSVGNDTTGKTPVRHQVSNGETLFTIAGYYQQNVAAIQKWNKLDDYNIKVGEELIVEWLPLPEQEEAVAEAPKPASTTVVKRKPKTSVFQRQFFKHEKEGKLRKKTKTAIGTTFDDRGQSLDNELYVMHSEAAIRTAIKITNPVNGKSVYAMVLGRLPNLPSNKGVQVSLPKGVAKKLNVRDKRTQVTCTYFTNK